MRLSARSLVALSLFSCVGQSCSQPTDLKGAPPSTSTDAVVYGTDDRRDYYDSSNETLRQLTRESIVALINPWTIDASDPEHVQFAGPTLAESHQLCEGERFGEQPTAAFCSGTLIDDDLVLTAGHCVNPANTDCAAEVRFVFNYYLDSATSLAPITTADIYGCQEVVAFAQGNVGVQTLDFAVVKLDRPVSAQRRPASVNVNSSAVAQRTSVSIIGMGSGIPAKLDDGGKVIDPRSSVRDFFTASTDSFGGNSGSGVFDSAGRVVGILVRGSRDYTNLGNCNVVNTLPDVGSGEGEAVTYVARAIDQLCQSGWPSERLCNAAASCGDGQCTGTEDVTSCPQDCTATCGNDRCEAGETQSCPQDCGTGISSGWTCEASYFGAGDGCDCGCGALDPDCEDPTQQLFNCAAGELCSAQGTCAPASAGEDWTCEPSYFAANDGCDCSCGAFDPDCADPTQSLYGCQDGQRCGPTGQCEDASGWICNPDFYDANDGCDCGCGVLDPDCAKEGQQLFGCAPSETCNAAGSCEEASVPAEWTCDPAFYAAQDDCDCNCGAYDPDCNNAELTVVGCLSGVCASDGTCGGSGCAHVETAGRSKAPPWFALLLLPALLAVARRRAAAFVGLLAMGLAAQIACVTETEQADPKPTAQEVTAEAKRRAQAQAAERVAQEKVASAMGAASTTPAAPAEEAPSGDKRPDGAACDNAGQCAGGVCEGKGCGPGEGVCASRERICTKDHRAYCGCDGKTFYGSGSCPGGRYVARRPCEAM